MGDCKDRQIGPGTDKMADLSVIRILSEHDTCRVYLLMEQFYERKWKKDIFMGKRAIAVLLGLCVIMTLPAFLSERNLQSGVTLLCQCIFLMGLIVYFGNRAWRKNINEKVG